MSINRIDEFSKQFYLGMPAHSHKTLEFLYAMPNNAVDVQIDITESLKSRDNKQWRH